MYKVASKIDFLKDVENREPAIPYIENGPVQRVKTEESTRHKRFKLNYYTITLQCRSDVAATSERLCYESQNNLIRSKYSD